MSFDYEILSQNDLLELFPFGRSKLLFSTECCLNV